MKRKGKPEELEALFAALADRTRLRLLALLEGREVCVCHFVEILRQGQPKISRHLAYLRRAGLVAARREGRWMHYRRTAPANADAARVLREMLAVLGEDKELQQDQRRLVRACCEPQGLVRLK